MGMVGITTPEATDPEERISHWRVREVSEDLALFTCEIEGVFAGAGAQLIHHGEQRYPRRKEGLFCSVQSDLLLGLSFQYPDENRPGTLFEFSHPDRVAVGTNALRLGVEVFGDAIP